MVLFIKIKTIHHLNRRILFRAQFLLQQGAAAIGIAAIGLVADRVGLTSPLLVACAVAGLIWLATFRRRGGMEAAFASHEESVPLRAAPPRL